MKSTIKKTIVTALSLAFIVCFSTGCALFGFDASGYVKACLDANMHGEFDEYASITNSSVEEVEQLYNDFLDDDLSFLKEKSPEEARNWLTSFQGVGLKTASIVMVFSLGMPAFPVDTHIYRVTGRLGLRPAKMDIDQTHMLMPDLFDPADYGTAHVNLILLGRRLCDARKPKCSACFLSDICDYFNA